MAPPTREERAIVPVPGSTAPPSRRSTSPARSPTQVIGRVHHRRPGGGGELRERWERQLPGVPLVVVESPYRALVGPLVAYLDVLDRAWPPDKPAPITFVVLPEYVARSWWERILYNQSARAPASVLLGRRHTVIVGRALPARRRRPAQARGARPGHRRGRWRRPGARRGGRCGGGRPGPGLSRWYRGAARRPGRGRDPTCRAGSSQSAEASYASWPTSAAPQFRRAVVALSGGRTDRPIVALAAEFAQAGQAELVGVHVVEIDWTLPLDADVAGRSEDAQRVLDIAEATAEAGHYKLETVLLQARDVGRGDRRRGDRAWRRPDHLRPAVPPPVRRRLRHRPHHPVHPEERPVRGLGRPRGDARGAASMKAVIVGCGRVGAGIADELDRAGWQVLIIDVSIGGLRPAAGHVQRDRPPGRRHRRGRPAPARRRETPTCSSP